MVCWPRTLAQTPYKIDIPVAPLASSEQHFAAQADFQHSQAPSCPSQPSTTSIYLAFAIFLGGPSQVPSADIFPHGFEGRPDATVRSMLFFLLEKGWRRHVLFDARERYELELNHRSVLWIHPTKTLRS